MSDEVERYRDRLHRVAEWLGTSQNILAITGAGLSADSGLPTYRGVGGLYDVDTTDDGLPIEAILSGEMLRRNPELTWKYLLHIAEACEGTKFNRGHTVLAEMEEYFPRLWVVTQNVDGFHRAAGSKHVIELHGDLHELRCMTCDYRMHVHEVRDLPLPPGCPCCHSLLRPDVVLFGEMLPLDKTERLTRELAIGFDLVFSIGTSSIFEYVTWPVEMARMNGIPTVEINPGETAVSAQVDLRLPLRAAPALDAIWSEFRRAH